MTLLAELFDRLDSTPLAVAQAPAGALVGVVEVAAPVQAPEARQKPAAVVSATRQRVPTPAPAPAAEAASEPQRIGWTAATASPAWLAARDAYLSHAMTCRACHAPISRHCPAGAELRATYENTPMEPTR